MLLVGLHDGRIVGLPLALFPTLQAAKASERSEFEIIARGHGVHWRRLDLDLSAAGLLSGRPDFSRRAKSEATERQLQSYFRSVAAFAKKRAG